MARLARLSEEAYENYLKKQPKSHFLQSYSWGELSKIKKNLTPYYLGLVDEKKNILGTALLLQKHLPMNYCYFYCPRGYVIDYEDEKLLEEMTREIIKFARSKKAIFVNPSYADGWFNLGLVYAGNNDISGCKECFKRVISIDSKYAYAYFALALAFETENNKEEAVKNYQKFL